MVQLPVKRSASVPAGFGGDLAAERAGIRSRGGLFTGVSGWEIRLDEVVG